MTSQNRTPRWKASIAYSIAGANMPNAAVPNSDEGALFCTDVICGLPLSRSREKMPRCSRPLIHDVIAAIDVKRFARHEPCCIVRQKGGGDANIIDADQATCRRL